MALFAQECLNPGVAKREVFGWAMYDFANSGYTTVVLTAVFNAYFVGVVAGGAEWATLAWTLTLGASNALVMLSMPAIGALCRCACGQEALAAGCPRWGACWPRPGWPGRARVTCGWRWPPWCSPTSAIRLRRVADAAFLP
jgi:hypothetical protein